MNMSAVQDNSLFASAPAMGTAFGTSASSPVYIAYANNLVQITPEEPSYLQTIANNAFTMTSEGMNAVINAHSETGEIETFEMAPPWAMSLQEQLTNLIANGHIESALELLETKLAGSNSEAKQIGVLNALDRALNNLQSIGGFDRELNAFMDLLTSSEVLQEVFFNPSPAVQNSFLDFLPGMDMLNMGGTGINGVAPDQVAFDPSSLIGEIATKAWEARERELAQTKLTLTPPTQEARFQPTMKLAA